MRIGRKLGVRAAVPYRARLLLILAALLSLALGGVAQAEKRVALVVGNAAYAHAGPLPNPVNDATDIARTLEGLGFLVTLGTDLTESDFTERLATFSAEVEGADVAVFYYAGHGMQFEERNYLVPVDATLANRFSVRRETLPLDDIIDAIDNARISLVFVDACRNNPLATVLQSSMPQSERATVVARGLAPVLVEDGSNTLIGFAAAPDRVAEDGEGRNSPFTLAMLKHLPSPGIEISTMFKRVTGDVRAATKGRQEPEQLTRMSAEFYMVPVERVADLGDPADPSGNDLAPLPANEDLAFQAALAIDTVGGWDAFLAQFGSGRYAGLAREARDKLLRAGAPAPEPEPMVEETPLPEPTDPAAVVARCDALAGDPSDPGREGDGVAFGKLDVAAALPACAAAVAAAPDLPRLSYQEGRLLEAADRDAEALAAYRRAAAAGYPEAMTAEARFLRDGIATSKDLQAAIALFRVAADRGSANAMASLGVINARGNGVTVDDEEAVFWYRKAAELGNAPAMNNLAFMYLEGRGLAKDETEAVRWYEKAVALGHAQAMYSLAWLLDSGAGVDRNSERAADLFLAALQSGGAFVVEGLSTSAGRLTAETRKAIQVRLQAGGFYAGAIDGAFGPGTKGALAKAAENAA